MQPFQISMPSLRAKKRVHKMQQAQEERISLIDNLGRPTPEPSRRRVKKKEPWTVTRMMRYLSLTAVSAMVTFFVLGRESRALHWQEFNHLLEPKLNKDQTQRCYVSFWISKCRKDLILNAFFSHQSTVRFHRLSLLPCYRAKEDMVNTNDVHALIQPYRCQTLIRNGETIIYVWSRMRNMHQRILTLCFSETVL